MGTTYEHAAIARCRQFRDPLYRRDRTYVTLGVTATRVLAKELLNIDYSGKIENWRGYVLSDNGKPPYIVPTYHPSHLLQGKQKLTGVLLRDLKRAQEVAAFGYTPDTVSLVLDPPPSWFSGWVDAAPHDCWMAVDIETAIKVGESEDDIEVPFGAITRVNFSYNPDQGVTVPWTPQYTPLIRRALDNPCVKVFWNERYDIPILEDNGYPVNGPIYDGMWAWHMLQSDLPKGLGFVSPFYSNLPPWKHESGTNESYYGAMDGIQQLRCMFGIARDLKASGQWESFLRYCVEFDSRVLHPMTKVGIALDSRRMLEFKDRLSQAASSTWEAIQSAVPPELRPLSPREGWKRKPKHIPADQLVEVEVDCEILVCDSCGARDVADSHACS